MSAERETSRAVMMRSGRSFLSSLAGATAALLALAAAAPHASTRCAGAPAAPAVPYSAVLLNQCPAPKFASPSGDDIYLACDSGVMRYTAATESLVRVATTDQCTNPQAVLYDAPTATVFTGCDNGLRTFRAQEDGTYTMAVLTTDYVPYLTYEPTLARYFFAAPGESAAIAVGSFSANSPTLTKLADIKQCGGATQVHASADGVVVASCWSSSSSPMPTAIKIVSGVVTTLLDSSVCYNPNSILRTPDGLVWTGCASGAGAPLLVVNETSLARLPAPLTSAHCNGISSFTRDPETNVIYAACGNVWAIAPAGAVTQVVDRTAANCAATMVTLSGDVKIVTCSYGDVLKVTSTEVARYLHNDCWMPLDLTFSRPNGDQSGTGTIDVLCNSPGRRQVATVTNSVKSPMPQRMPCDASRIQRDRLNPDTILVSCPPPTQNLLYTVTPDTATAFNIASAVNGNACSGAIVQMADGAIMVACYKQIFTANFTNSRVLRTADADSCPAYFKNLVVDATGTSLVAQCAYQLRTHQLVQFDPSATGAVKVALPYELPPAGLCSGDVLSPTVDAATGLFVGGCNSNSKVIVAFDFAAQTSTLLRADTGCIFTHLVAHANTYYYSCTSGIWAAQSDSVQPRVSPLLLLASAQCASTNAAHRLAFDAVTHSLYVACVESVLKVDVSALVFPTEPAALSSTGPNGAAPTLNMPTYSSTGDSVSPFDSTGGAPPPSPSPSPVAPAHATITSLAFDLTLEQASSTFQSSVARAMCTAVGLPSSRCVPVSVVAGSVIVQTRIDPPAAGDSTGQSITVDDAVNSIQAQFADSQSMLRRSSAFASVDPSRAMQTATIAQCADGSFTQPCPSGCTPATCAAHATDSSFPLLLAATAVALVMAF